MDWTAGFPERYRFLDEEHTEIGALLAALKSASAPNAEKNPALVSRRLYKKIAEHMSHEEEVMKTNAYPDWELHEKHHEQVVQSIELILQLFNRKGMAEHHVAIAKHIENKMSEEMFIDNMFAKFLAEQDSRA